MRRKRAFIFVLSANPSAALKLLWLILEKLILSCIIHLMVCILVSILNPSLMVYAIFHKIFWHLNFTQPFLYFWVSLVYIFSKNHNIFVSLSGWNFISASMGFTTHSLKKIMLNLWQSIASVRAYCQLYTVLDSFV